MENIKPRIKKGKRKGDLKTSKDIKEERLSKERGSTKDIKKRIKASKVAKQSRKVNRK